MNKTDPGILIEESGPRGPGIQFTREVWSLIAMEYGNIDFERVELIFSLNGADIVLYKQDNSRGNSLLFLSVKIGSPAKCRL